MAVYQAKYIPDMNKANPTGADPKKEGDDAIREVKDVLQTTFPNFETGVQVTATAGELNSLSESRLVRGTIVMWAGDQIIWPSGPDGWTICDGRARKSGGGVAPDLRGSFIMGARMDADGSSPFIPVAGDTGGSNETIIEDLAGDPVVFSTDGHNLTVQELPPHEHNLAKQQGSNPPGLGEIGDGEYLADKTSAFGELAYSLNGTQAPGAPFVGKTGTQTSNTGSSHAHTFSIATTDTGSNAPAYYAAVFIIKD